MGQCITYFFPAKETIVQPFKEAVDERPQKKTAGKISKPLDLGPPKADNSIKRMYGRPPRCSVEGQPLRITDIEDMDKDVENSTTAEGEYCEASQSKLTDNEGGGLKSCQSKLSDSDGGGLASASAEKSRNKSEQPKHGEERKVSIRGVRASGVRRIYVRPLESFTSTSASDDSITDSETDNRKIPPLPRPSPWRELYLKAIKPKEIAATTKKELRLLQERPKSRVGWFELKPRFNRRPRLSRLRRRRRIVPAQQDEQGPVANAHVRGKIKVIHVAEAPLRDDAGIVGGILLLHGIDETACVPRPEVEVKGDDDGYFASGEDN